MKFDLKVVVDVSIAEILIALSVLVPVLHNIQWH